MSEICKTPTINVRAVQVAASKPAVAHMPGHSPKGRKLAKAKKPRRLNHKPVDEAALVAEVCEPDIAATPVAKIPAEPVPVAVVKPPSELDDVLASVNRGDADTATAAGLRAGDPGTSADGGFGSATRVARAAEATASSVPGVQLPGLGAAAGIPSLPSLPNPVPLAPAPAPAPAPVPAPVATIDLSNNPSSDSGESAEDNITNNVKPELFGVGEPNRPVEIRVTDAVGQVVEYTAMADANGNWVLNMATAIPVNGTSLAANGLAEGDVKLEVKTSNEAGVFATNVGGFEVDITAPVVNLDVDPTSPNPNLPVLLVESNEANRAITVELNLGNGTSVSYVVKTDAAGKASIDLSTQQPILGALPSTGLPTAVTYTVSQKDVAGNEGSYQPAIQPPADPEVVPAGSNKTFGSTVTEGGNVVFTVELNKAPTSALVLDYKLGATTDTVLATDYVGEPRFSGGVTYDAVAGKITIPVGVTSFTVTYPSVDDALVEPSETLSIVVGGAVITSTILDNDVASIVAPGTPGALLPDGTPASSKVPEVTEGGNLVYQFGLSKESTQSTSFPFVFGASADTATTAKDYVQAVVFSNGVTLSADGKTITVPAGVVEFTATVKTTDDALVEARESLTLTAGGVVLAGGILDNDSTSIVAPGTPGALLPDGTPASSKAPEVTEGGNLVYQFGLSKESALSISFPFVFGAGPDTATATKDYVQAVVFSNGVTLSADGKTITVPAGVVEFTATVKTTDDALVEVRESLTLTAGGVVLTGGILDNDSASIVAPGTPGALLPDGTPASSKAPEVTEGGNLVYQFGLSKESTQSTSFPFVFGASSDTATTVKDYVQAVVFSNGVTLSADGKIITVPAGVVEFTATVKTIDDTSFEVPRESLTLTVGGVVLEGGILDNDKALGSIGDTVWLDANRDGTLNAGEVGAAGVRVSLINTADGSTLTTLTNANGKYLFSDLPEGRYTVTVFDKAGYELTTQAGTGKADNDKSDFNVISKSVTVELGAGENLRTIDAGLVQKLGSIGDTVWLDANRDGLEGAAEKGAAGVVVTLVKADGTTATTTTDANGKYLFDKLVEGQYTVKVGSKAGYEASTALEIPVTLAAGQNLLTADAGLKTILGSIDSIAYWDMNGDGKQSAGENGIAGLSIQLVDATTGRVVTDIDGKPMVALTDKDGRYQFVGLEPGNYRLDVLEKDVSKIQVHSGDATALKALEAGQAINGFSQVGDKTFNMWSVNDRVVGATPPLQPAQDAAPEVWQKYYEDYDAYANAQLTGLNTASSLNRDGLTSVITVAGAPAATQNFGVTFSTAVNITPYAGKSIAIKGAEIDTRIEYANVAVLYGEYNGKGITTVCLDPFVPLLTGADYTNYQQVAASSYYGSSPEGVRITQNLTLLYANFLPSKQLDASGQIITTIESAAFQLAAWEIVAEKTGAYTVLDGAGFRVNEPATLDADLQAVYARANEMLAKLAEPGLSAKGLELQVLTNGHQSQDLLLIEPANTPLASPLVLDLDGNGIQTTALRDSGDLRFDLLNTGDAVRSGWLVKGDGFLVIDTNANGRIDDRSEMFGGAIGEGFAKLAHYDSNGDGVINIDDGESFLQLKVWQDANGDRVTDPGELQSLAEVGVAALKLAYEIDPSSNNGNLIIEKSTAVTQDGREIALQDVYFQVDAEGLSVANVQALAEMAQASASAETLMAVADRTELQTARAEALADDADQTDSPVGSVGDVFSWAMTDASATKPSSAAFAAHSKDAALDLKDLLPSDGKQDLTNYLRFDHNEANSAAHAQNQGSGEQGKGGQTDVPQVGLTNADMLHGVPSESDHQLIQELMQIGKLHSDNNS